MIHISEPSLYQNYHHYYNFQSVEQVKRVLGVSQHISLQLPADLYQFVFINLYEFIVVVFLDHGLVHGAQVLRYLLL